MDMTHTYWEENSNTQSVKYEGCHTIENPGAIKDDRAIYTCCDSNLNFSTATCSEDDCEYGPYKKSKVSRQDPLSHRIIEKRRRDRMNNCLADLSRLIPTDYLKKGRGRIEKTEIIEMAIKHMKFLQSSDRTSPIEHYKLGYRECITEAMRFMVEVEGHFPREPICVRLLNHLQKHCDQVSKNYDSSSTYSDFKHVPAYSAEVPTLIKNKLFNNNNNVQSKLREFNMPKAEPANSNCNSNDSHSNTSISEPQKVDDFEKEIGTTGMSYKYKTSIKLRFNQDVSAHEVPKRQKLNNGSKNVVASLENQSLNQSVPPSNEPYTRISDNENMHSPTNSIARKNGHVLEENMQELSPLSKAYSSDDNNFNIPIFVLHAKGSYYVPLTIDYKTLLPFLHNYNILDIAPSMTNVVLHPVTINVNFLSSYNEKQNKQYRYKCYNSH